MRNRYLLPSLALVLFCNGCTGVRPENLSVPTQDEALSLLKNGRYGALDQRYGAIQRAYKQGRISDEDLRADFRVFYATDPALGARYDAWVAHSPKSYVAHLAKGIYFKRVGLERRGTQFISDTSEQQIRGMEAAYEIAGREFDLSLKLDDRPLLTYMHSMDLSLADGDKERARQSLDRAVAIDPHNSIVREKYMGSLQTRWGGSTDEMRAFLVECRKAKLSERHMKVLEALVLEDEGWTHEYRDGDLQAAVPAYLQAAQLNPSHDCFACVRLNEAADALRAQPDYPGAMALYSKVLEVDPTSIDALESRAYIELQLHQMNASREDFRRAADQGDMYAEDMLGRSYLLPDPDRDLDKAVEWLRKAADQGYQPSQKTLPSVLAEIQRRAAQSEHP